MGIKRFIVAIIPIIFIFVPSINAKDHVIKNCTPFQMNVKYKGMAGSEKNVIMKANSEIKIPILRFKSTTICGIELTPTTYFSGNATDDIIKKVYKLVETPPDILFITCEFECEKNATELTVPLKPKKVRFYLIGLQTIVEFGYLKHLSGGIEASSVWFDALSGLAIK